MDLNNNKIGNIEFADVNVRIQVYDGDIGKGYLKDEIWLHNTTHINARRIAKLVLAGYLYGGAFQIGVGKGTTADSETFDATLIDPLGYESVMSSNYNGKLYTPIKGYTDTRTGMWIEDAVSNSLQNYIIPSGLRYIPGRLCIGSAHADYVTLSTDLNDNCEKLIITKLFPSQDQVNHWLGTNPTEVMKILTYTYEQYGDPTANPPQAGTDAEFNVVDEPNTIPAINMGSDTINSNYINEITLFTSELTQPAVGQNANLVSDSTYLNKLHGIRRYRRTVVTNATQNTPVNLRWEESNIPAVINTTGESRYIFGTANNDLWMFFFTNLHGYFGNLSDQPANIYNIISSDCGYFSIPQSGDTYRKLGYQKLDYCKMGDIPTATGNFTIGYKEYSTSYGIVPRIGYAWQYTYPAESQQTYADKQYIISNTYYPIYTYLHKLTGLAPSSDTHTTNWHTRQLLARVRLPQTNTFAKGVNDALKIDWILKFTKPA